MPDTIKEIFSTFFRLGLTSFGGPIAHLGYLHEDIVKRRKWITEHDYADLVALCQFLPGPASSQLVFAIGQRRGGLPGALAGSIAFLLPSAAVMIGIAYGIGRVGQLAHVGWLQGLKVAAVAVVAQAVVGMYRTFCTDRRRATVAIAGALIVLSLNSVWGQLLALAAGAFAGMFQLAGTSAVLAPSSPQVHRGSELRAGATALVVWGVLLLALPAVALTTHYPLLEVFDRFYRAGSLVFGGGHVVLPLLRTAVVPPGWVSDNIFLAGYGAAQAMPGPLFSFAGYLGASMEIGPGGWLGGLWALLAIFLPAWLLVGGALPFWDRLRVLPGLRAVMDGINLAVVGVLIAALYRPVGLDGIQSPLQFGLGLVGFAALSLWRAPAWAVVVASAVLGALFL